MKKFALAALVMVGISAPAFAAGNADAGKADFALCAACHGTDGNSMVPNFPKLAGQHASYIEKQLHDFKSGARKDPTMTGMAAPLTDQKIADIAAFVSSQTVSIGSANAAAAAKGKVIFTGGVKASGVPACMACHGPDGAGNPAAKYPSLRGQQVAYVEKALKDFRSGARANDPNKMMRDIAVKLTDAEIADVAQYITGLH